MLDAQWSWLRSRSAGLVCRQIGIAGQFTGVQPSPLSSPAKGVTEMNGTSRRGPALSTLTTASILQVLCGDTFMSPCWQRKPHAERLHPKSPDGMQDAALQLRGARNGHLEHHGQERRGAGTHNGRESGASCCRKGNQLMSATHHGSYSV